MFEQWRQRMIRSALRADVAIRGIKTVARRFGMSQAYIKAVINKNRPATADLSTKLGLVYRVGIDFASERDHSVGAVVNKHSGQVIQFIVDEVE